MADRSILTVPQSGVYPNGYLFAEMNQQLVKVPVDSFTLSEGGDAIPDNASYCYIDASEEGAGSEFILVDVIEGNDSGGVANVFVELDNPNRYSYDEVVVGTWIDGKPLYRRMARLSDLPSNGSSTTYSITSLKDAGIQHVHVDLGHTMFYESSASPTSGRWMYSPVYSNQDLLKGLRAAIVVADNGEFVEVSVMSGSTANLSNYQILVCIEYTKDNDVAQEE